jgi:hypothetical protein
MKSIKNQYIDLQEGKMSQAQFLRNVRLNMPQYVTNVTSFGDTIKILRNKGILSEADIKYKDGKDMYAQFNEIDNLNGQEYKTGIAVEHDCFPNKTKEEIIKIVVKNLKKNPFYYTDYKMSNVAGYEPEYIGGKSANADARHMKPVEKDNLVDKAMGMKPVKGFEKAKASSNKASKETNKGEDVEIMSLIAKTVRGLVKMDATGEKVKKIIVKEGTNLNEGPLGTQLLRKADAALKAGQTVTVLGTPIMKIVVPAGALFPADGGPSFRLNNLENPLEDILVDGNEIELDLPAPQAPRVDTRTPDQIAADQAAFNDRYGPGGGYDTPMGRRTFDEAMDNLNRVPTIVKAGENARGRIVLLLSNGEQVGVTGSDLEGIYGGDSNNLDYYIGKKWDQDDFGTDDRDFNGEDYEPDTDADYEEPNDDFDMAEAMGNTLLQAQQYIASNPTLKAADIKLQKSGDDTILSYNSYSPLTPELAAALEKQFDFEEDQVDGSGEDKDKIYYTLSSKHTTPNVGVGLQSMEEMIRKIVREMFDGRDNVTDVTGETL